MLCKDREPDKRKCNERVQCDILACLHKKRQKKKKAVLINDKSFYDIKKIFFFFIEHSVIFYEGILGWCQRMGLYRTL